MLNTSTDLLLIAIAISVLGLTGYLSYLIYSLAKVVQESKKTVEDVNKKLGKIDPIVESSAETISSLMETLKSINDNLLKPVASFSKLFKNVRQAVEVFTAKK